MVFLSYLFSFINLMLAREQQQEQQKKKNNDIKDNNNNNRSKIIAGSNSFINTVFKHMDGNNNEDHLQHLKNNDDNKTEKKIKNNIKNIDILDNDGPSKQKDNNDPNNDYNSIDKDNVDDDASILSAQTQRCLVIRRLTYIIIVNAVTPILLYYLLKPYLPPVWALVLSSTPTIISVLIQATFLRHMDTIGIASICGFLVSIILAVANGDPKLMMMRESLMYVK
ncbi:hypothetical protein BDC45DRAFT_295634 [Circinella umbellata]|nr:hypothetical protein BDC45DRAFT_295634 [Circinella umbellata]